MITGEKIRQIRMENNMTQHQLSKKIGYLNQSQIAKIEKGCRKITDIDLKKFAESLGVSVEELIKDELKGDK